MKRSLQEIVELIVFGLLALLIGTGVLWVLGWLLGIVAIVFKFIAGILWLLLRYILPIAIVAGVVFFIVRFFVNRGKTDKPIVEAVPEPKTKEVEEVQSSVVNTKLETKTLEVEDTIQDSNETSIKSSDDKKTD
jgi:hypothetical protein